MANQKQFDILKQGAESWNQFRKRKKTIKIDLSDINLFDTDVIGANLNGVDLSGANLQASLFTDIDFRKADFSGANLSWASFYGADFTRANLSNADLIGVEFIGGNFSRVNLRSSKLINANFLEADLNVVNLNKANLDLAIFRVVSFKGVNFNQTMLDRTTFADVEFLDGLKGLDKSNYSGPSYIDALTLQSAGGQLPEVFRRGCGLSDVEIENSKLANPTLTNEEISKIIYRIYELRATQSIQISPLFISYSHADTPFVDKLDKTLVEKGIRFWRDIHDMTSGRMERQIDRAIRQNPTVLLVLSKNSLNSDWVQHEARKAREIEKELGRDVLCPVALDDSWKSTPWPARIMEQIMEYNILDFSGWEDPRIFEAKFSKLLNGLDLFYKKPEK